MSPEDKKRTENPASSDRQENQVDLFFSERPWLSRTAWAGLGLGSWFVLITAAWLHADDRGFGTHQQLGLPPCTFETMTHVPCPGCGLTTSFTFMAHGSPWHALTAHPMGPVLFVITVVLAVVSPWALRRGAAVHRVAQHPAVTVALGVSLVLGIGTWIWRIAHKFLFL